MEFILVFYLWRCRITGVLCRLERKLDQIRSRTHSYKLHLVNHLDKDILRLDRLDSTIQSSLTQFVCPYISFYNQPIQKKRKKLF